MFRTVHFAIALLFLPLISIAAAPTRADEILCFDLRTSIDFAARRIVIFPRESKSNSKAVDISEGFFVNADAIGGKALDGTSTRIPHSEIEFVQVTRRMLQQNIAVQMSSYPVVGEIGASRMFILEFRPDELKSSDGVLSMAREPPTDCSSERPNSTTSWTVREVVRITPDPARGLIVQGELVTYGWRMTGGGGGSPGSIFGTSKGG